MKLTRIPARLAALIVGGALVMSCDTRLPTTPGGGSGTSTNPLGPTVHILVPNSGSLVNVGDSALTVTVHLSDDVGLQSVTLSAASVRGSAVLGTLVSTPRYQTITAPALGSFTPGPGQFDTTVTRALLRISADTSTKDTLVVVATAHNSRNQTTVDTMRVKLVNGPVTNFVQPIPGDSVVAGDQLQVALHATSKIGIDSLGFNIQGVPGLPAVSGQQFPAHPLDTIYRATFTIPTGTPRGTMITLTAFSRDAAGQPGSSSRVSVMVGSGLPRAPLVYQQVPARVETNDAITVSVVGSGIKSVGFTVLDSLQQAQIGGYSVAVTPATPFPYVLPLKLPTTARGQRAYVKSFATDSLGRTGYSLPAGVFSSQSDPTKARLDSMIIVYGQTYVPPGGRTGLLADVAVDQLHGNVFVSNINYGRLEVWQPNGVTGAFDANGVIVGSQPWGMTLSRTAANHDTLYVANSGGTNLSRVYVGATSIPASGMHEDLANRIITRVSFAYTVTEVKDPATLKIRLSIAKAGPYSDRPQYVQQAPSGRLYFSTKPTLAAPQGTIRYLNPAAPVPDQRFILDFATDGTDLNSFLLVNVDSAFVGSALATSAASDTLYLCDHPTGTAQPSLCARSAVGILSAIDSLRAKVPTTDVVIARNKSAGSLGLTDTTFVAASGDGRAIAFGEGHTAPFSRAMIAFDTLHVVDPSLTGTYSSASPSVSITDLVNNSADQIFGVALDSAGQTLAIHGVETSFATVLNPFALRLQGKKTTFSSGAGVAFHPQANGITTAQDKRLAFVASNNGTVELIDIAYYDFNRGTLATKYNLYGPLRASLPFPTDNQGILPSNPNYVVLKLFGVSQKGLVVIDVTSRDILPGP
jgi:hypothetical protein